MGKAKVRPRYASDPDHINHIAAHGMRAINPLTGTYGGECVAWGWPADPEDVEFVLSGDKDAALDARSNWLWVQLPDGSLMLGVFPQGDTYVEVSESRSGAMPHDIPDKPISPELICQVREFLQELMGG